MLKTGAVVTSIDTAEICESISVSIVSVALGDSLYGLFGSSV